MTQARDGRIRKVVLTYGVCCVVLVMISYVHPSWLPRSEQLRWFRLPGAYRGPAAQIGLGLLPVLVGLMAYSTGQLANVLLKAKRSDLCRSGALVWSFAISTRRGTNQEARHRHF